MEQNKAYCIGLKNNEEQRELERCILGAILINSKMEIPGNLKLDLFYFPAHRTVMTAILEMKAQKLIPDILTLNQYLAKTGKQDESGGISYVGSLTNVVPSSANFDYYLEQLTESYCRRSFYAQLTASREAIAEGKELMLVFEGLSQSIQTIASVKSTTPPEWRGMLFW